MGIPCPTLPLEAAVVAHGSPPQRFTLRRVAGAGLARRGPDPHPEAA